VGAVELWSSIIIAEQLTAGAKASQTVLLAAFEQESRGMEQLRGTELQSNEHVALPEHGPSTLQFNGTTIEALLCSKQLARTMLQLLLLAALEEQFTNTVQLTRSE
jgi:hypothetical protein